MDSCESRIVVWVIIAIIVTALITVACCYAYVQYKYQQYINQFSQSSRSCSDVGAITYRQAVYKPTTNGVYEQNLAIALLDISINTTKANCQTILPLSNPPGFNSQLRIEGVEPISGQQTMFGYIFWDTILRHAVFSFTGTANKAVGQSNLQYQQVPPTALNGYTSGILCHEGFYGIYSNIRDQLWNWWTQHGSRINTLYITGHSLGGALSTLCSFDFAQISSELVHYSFAAPRVGNTGFVNSFTERVPTSLRINNTEDPIPQLPPARIGDWIYAQSQGNIPFTKTLDTLSQDHVEAYIDYLPKEAQVAKSKVN